MKVCYTWLLAVGWPHSPSALLCKFMAMIVTVSVCKPRLQLSRSLHASSYEGLQVKLCLVIRMSSSSSNGVPFEGIKLMRNLASQYNLHCTGAGHNVLLI
jgi:hypothetical protein